MIFHFNTSDAYNLSKQTIPENLKHFHLVIVHYNSPKTSLNQVEFVSTRYTSRTRDLIKKRAKMLHFDVSVAYLFDDDCFERFNKTLNTSESDYFLIMGYRLYKDKWVSTVDKIYLPQIVWIEE